MYQRIQKFLIFPFIFFNVDISFHIKDILPKFSVVVFDVIMEGTVSQICYLGPSFGFMFIFIKFIKCFPIFVIKYKLGPKYKI